MVKLDGRDVKIVAEIGLNHGGSMDTAKEMIRVAAMCGVDYVKFQKRDLGSLPESAKSKPRNDANAFGDTEYSHRAALEFSIGQHEDLQAYAGKWGLRYSCSAWDRKSAEELMALGVDYIKVPSACNQKFWSWGIPPYVPIHVSLGMLTSEERDHIVNKARTEFRHMTPYACTSKYPCQMKDSYLLEIPYLRGRMELGDVGFSGHHNGIALDIAAAILGASWIERHFTLDRTSKGTDHAASLEPEGLRKVVRDIKAVSDAWKNKPGQLPECEIECRKKFKETK